MASLKDNPAPVKSRPFSPETYSAIVRDARLSHGAFRYWHLLRDYSNDEGICFPGMRRLSRELGSNFGCIGKWRGELIAAGYLSIAERKKGQPMVYRLSGGVAATGNGVLPQPATVSVAAFAPSVAAFTSKVLPDPATKLNPLELNPKNRMGEAPGNGALSGADRISSEHEIQRIEARLKAIRDGASETAWGPSYNEREKLERKQLKERLAEIKVRLGWLA